MSRFSVTGLSFRPFSCRSRRCLEWPPWLGPSFFYLLATSFFPDLPCLVCTSGPSITLLFPLSTPSSLHSPPRLAAFVSTSPPPNLWLEETFSSICLTWHLPRCSSRMQLLFLFALSPLRRLLVLFSATRAQHQQTCYTWRAELLDAHTVAADQRFPFYCTPYYGYSPPTHHDMHTMIFELATFLTSFAFFDDGSALQELESAPPSPGSLLSPLSSIHSDHMNVYPGEGVFFLDNCPDPTKIGRKAFSRSIPGMDEVGKRKAWEVMSISVEVPSIAFASSLAQAVSAQVSSSEHQQ